jgi:hypothetical protein
MFQNENLSQYPCSLCKEFHVMFFQDQYSECCASDKAWKQENERLNEEGLKLKNRTEKIYKSIQKEYWSNEQITKLASEGLKSIRR